MNEFSDLEDRVKKLETEVKALEARIKELEKVTGRSRSSTRPYVGGKEFEERKKRTIADWKKRNDIIRGND